MVVWFTTTFAISAYHHCSCELEYHSWRGVLDTTLCDKSLSLTCDRFVVFSDTPVSSTNKTDCHDITEIFLKMALNTITLNSFDMEVISPKLLVCQWHIYSRFIRILFTPHDTEFLYCRPCTFLVERDYYMTSITTQNRKWNIF